MGGRLQIGMVGEIISECWATSSGIRTSKARPRVIVGSTWTTDAPFRETAEAIEAARTKGILGVEMEAAALYAFARSSGVRLLCLAHVTNTMGQDGADFEKGEADGTQDALSVLSSVIEALYSAN